MSNLKFVEQIYFNFGNKFYFDLKNFQTIKID